MASMLAYLSSLRVCLRLLLLDFFLAISFTIGDGKLAELTDLGEEGEINSDGFDCMGVAVGLEIVDFS